MRLVADAGHEHVLAQLLPPSSGHVVEAEPASSDLSPLHRTARQKCQHTQRHRQLASLILGKRPQTRRQASCMHGHACVDAPVVIAIVHIALGYALAVVTTKLR